MAQHNIEDLGCLCKKFKILEILQNHSYQCKITVIYIRK